jgi:hypothetical protein
MKFRFNKFVTAINTAAVDAINTVAGVWDEIALADDEKETRYRLSAYGEFPVMIDGVQVMQVVDRQAGELMASNFNKFGTQLAMFFKGVPVFEGHADDATWSRENPGHKPMAVGRIKAIEPEADGIWVRTVFNSAGVEALSGTAPRYSGHSPRWRMTPVEGRAGHFRPCLLWSDALTNNPNMADNTVALNALGLGTTPPTEPSPKDPEVNPENTTEMKLTPEALAALGFAPDATPTEAEISAAIIKFHSEKKSVESEKLVADSAVVAANSRAIGFETELKELRATAVNTAIETAITSGRITEAERPQWVTALNTSFKSESAKLNNLMPVLNTGNRLPALERKDPAVLAAGIDAINTAAREIAKRDGLKLTDAADYDAVWTKLRAEKPELFAKA